MTRIAVVSDSHGGAFHLESFAEFCAIEKIDRVYHLGDFVHDARWLEEHLNVPVTYVAGNCDYMVRWARETIETVEGKRLLLVHGDKYDVKYGYTQLSYYAEDKKADAALFGHTHEPCVQYMGKVLMINPGALKDGKMCILNVTAKDIVPRLMDVDDWFRERRERGN